MFAFYSYIVNSLVNIKKKLKHKVEHMICCSILTSWSACSKKVIYHQDWIHLFPRRMFEKCTFKKFLKTCGHVLFCSTEKRKWFLYLCTLSGRHYMVKKPKQQELGQMFKYIMSLLERIIYSDVIQQLQCPCDKIAHHLTWQVTLGCPVLVEVCLDTPTQPILWRISG